MSADLLPHEATTEFIAGQQATRPLFQAFIETLDEGQRRRFHELMHDVAYTAFMDGLGRPAPLSNEMAERVLAHEVALYAEGAGDATDPKLKLEGN
ncbi:MAG: hypothetical protein U0520_05265 [Candidatus Saccharimonadales bacterium]